MNITSLLSLMSEVVNIRSYNDRPVTEQVKEQLFEAFSLGPSSVSTQARELLVIESPDQYAAVVTSTLDPYLTKESHGAQAWIHKAPLVCIVLIERRRALARAGERGLSIAIQEADSAMQNFRLAARLLELSTACIREFDANRLQTSLNLPWYVEPIAILTAGYSDQMVSPPPHLDISHIVSKGEWT